MFNNFLIILVWFLWSSLFIIIGNVFINYSVSTKNSHLWFLTIALYISLNIAGYLGHMSISHAISNNHSFESVFGRQSDNIIVPITSCSSLYLACKTMSWSFSICVHYVWFVNYFKNLLKLRCVITSYFKFKSLPLFLCLFPLAFFLFRILKFLISLRISIGIRGSLKTHLIFFIPS